MFKHSLPSIEKFAAFLDGNLSQSEMQQFSQMVEHDNELHQLLDASKVVDNTIAGFTDSDMQLPPEITGSSFALPTIPTEGISPLVTLTPETADEFLVASSACAGEDTSLFTDKILDEGVGSPDSMDHSINLFPEDNGLDNGDVFSNSISDDF